jgi:hypothetical protein
VLRLNTDGSAAPRGPFGSSLGRCRTSRRTRIATRKGWRSMRSAPCSSQSWVCPASFPCSSRNAATSCIAPRGCADYGRLLRRSSERSWQSGADLRAWNLYRRQPHSRAPGRRGPRLIRWRPRGRVRARPCRYGSGVLCPPAVCGDRPRTVLTPGVNQSIAHPSKFRPSSLYARCLPEPDIRLERGDSCGLTTPAAIFATQFAG